MKNIFWMGTVLFLTLSAQGATPTQPEKAPCPATGREFITTLEYLRQEKDLSLPENEARKVASTVAQGCDGAADRFIRVVRVLKTAGLGGADSAKSGILFASKTEAETKAFIVVFQEAFAQEGLDLDLETSVKMARSLSSDYEGDLVNARKDFNTLLGFCLSEKNLNLPKPRCGDFAVGLARKGGDWSQGVAKAFLTSFDFLRSDPGPALSTDQALKAAEMLISAGPGAPENFMLTYRYASSEKGLAMPRNEAIAFAQGLSVQTPQTASTEESSKPQPVKVLQRRIGSVSKTKGQ